MNKKQTAKLIDSLVADVQAAHGTDCTPEEARTLLCRAIKLNRAELVAATNPPAPAETTETTETTES